MARLETQINQVFLVSPENKKSSLILYEEQIGQTSQLFVLAELADITKKTEAADLKKISEIILSTFRENKKLTGETLFEASLAEINQMLADFAHGGRKTWLGKLSALIALKSGSNIYLCNSGLTNAWLKRKSELIEILASEKRGLHPLKTFTNFSSGKIKTGDSLILTTSNIFNYLAFQLFSKFLVDYSSSEASSRISKILQDSAPPEEGFATFMLDFTEEQPAPQPISTQPVYAPLPEDLASETKTKFNFNFSLPKITGSLKNFSIPKLPAFNIPSGLPGQSRILQSFQRLSTAGKFFFISFIIFILLFGINLIAFGFRQHSKNAQERTESKIEQLNNTLAEAESALIYKNEPEALELLQQAKNELEELRKIDEDAAREQEPGVNAAYNKINRITVIENPRVFAEVKYLPKHLTRAGSGFFLTGEDSKTISTYNNQTLENLILLNDTNGPIRGIAHVPNIGNVVLTTTTLYRVNEVQNEFNALTEINGADFVSLKFLGPNRLYSLDKNNNQVTRFTISNGRFTSQNLLPGGLDLSAARDLGADNEVYVLFPNKLNKYSSGNERPLDLILSDPITDANRLFIASQIYVLESSKKRLLIFNKDGTLANQIIFPSLSSIADLYVDETQRSLYLLENNRLLEITF